MSLESMMESVGTLLRPTTGRDRMQGVTQNYRPILSGFPCSQQQAGASVVMRYAQRQTSVGTTIYLAQDIGAQVNDKIDVTDMLGKTTSYLVKGETQPIGIGTIWSVDCEKIDAPR